MHVLPAGRTGMATPSRRASRRQRYWFPRPFPQRLGGVGIGRRHLAIRMVDKGLACDRDLHSDGRVRSFTAGPLPHHIVEDGELARVFVTLLVLASGPLLIGLVGPLLVGVAWLALVQLRPGRDRRGVVDGMPDSGRFGHCNGRGGRPARCCRSGGRRRSGTRSQGSRRQRKHSPRLSASRCPIDGSVSGRLEAPPFRPSAARVASGHGTG